MSNDSPNGNAQVPPVVRLPYEKPALARIDILGDQVLADSCKALDSTFGAVTGATGCANRGCFTSGSS